MATVSRGTKTEKFAFIERHRDEYGVTLLCSYLDVSRNGFYKWEKREESTRSKIDALLLKKIRAIFTKSQGIYGSPRIHDKLRSMGVRVGRKRVARLMREAGLKARFARIYRTRVKVPTYKTVAENLRLQGATATAVNQIWTADITYLPFGHKWFYLAAIMDLYSRRIVGWSIGKHKSTDLVKSALVYAVRKRRPRDGLILHTDRGSEFISAESKRFTESLGIIRSMSRPYKSIDNAEIESFFQKLKGEYLHGKIYRSVRAARKLIAYYINGFYNLVRSHSSLNYASPIKFEAIHS